MNSYKRIFSRFYAVYFNYNQYITKTSKDIKILFMESLKINNFDENLSNSIINNCTIQKDKILKICGKYQKRQEGSIDKLLSIILYTAISEFLLNKTDYKIIISEYIKITIFIHPTGKEFIKSILHSIFNDM
ncbi:hypothetical protein AB836_01315 [Rickettsiales bacterium (ex Bugula neritina AB1)]|nr:hypothetical protein AB836_01315 [Rickettsiales bacterium (ex Bugula neritina AB1)]